MKIKENNVKSANKNYIPGTNPDWGKELPDGYNNSLVDKAGYSWDNGFNFDEKDDEGTEEKGFETLLKDRELADYAKKQVIYTGFFVNPDEVYSSFPPHLAHKIRDPHVTVAFRPGADKIFLDLLGSKANIRAVGYGNDGRNEGLLVEVYAEDPAIQKVLDGRSEFDDRTGESKKVPTHITLSIAEGAKAVDTKNLDFTPLAHPVNLTGNYELFSKKGTLISDKDTVLKMQSHNLSPQEVIDPDRL